MRALIILFLTIINCCTYGETICFLLTEKGRYNDSFVIQLSKSEEIAYARRIIAEPTNSELRRTGITASIALGADGINRNYLAPGAPEWSWHIKEFFGFGGCGIPESEFTPTQIEWNPTYFTTKTYVTNGSSILVGGYPYPSVCFGNYRITSELGPILEVTIAQTSTNLLLNWADLNKIPFQIQSDWGYYYTIESRNSISEIWSPLPDINWPLLTNQWSLPKSNISGFYRVKAQKVPPPWWLRIYGSGGSGK